jgi:hypothetical protein
LWPFDVDKENIILCIILVSVLRFMAYLRG